MGPIKKPRTLTSKDFLYMTHRYRLLWARSVADSGIDRRGGGGVGGADFCKNLYTPSTAGHSYALEGSGGACPRTSLEHMNFVI